MSSADRIIYEFADFRLIPGEGLLLQDGHPVPLSLKTFATLVLLVERNGHLVSKAEFIDVVWEDAFVEEAALSRCIWNIRHVLGGDSKESFVQTIPRRGYRFVAPVKVLNSPETDPALSGPPPAISTGYRLPLIPEPHDLEDSLEPDKSRAHESPQTKEEVGAPAVKTGRGRAVSTSLGFVLGLVLVAMVTTVAAYFYFGLVEISVLDSKSVAVLPFKSVNANSRDEFFELAVADALVHRLSAAEKLVVRPFAATRKYTDVDKDPVESGRELKVNYIVDASYQRADGKIRIAARLIDVASGAIEATHKVDVGEASAFEMQDVVAEEIGKAFLVRLTGRSTSAEPWRGTDNETAYRLYLQGMNLSEERGVQNLQKALEYLERAVALDPNYATAWAGVAHLHRDIVGHTDADSKEHYDRSMEAVAKALAIDPNLSDAYSARCANKHRYEYDQEGAEADCRHAIDLDPNSPLAHKTYANYLYASGRFDESITHIKRAIELQPISYKNQQVLGLAFHFARRYPEAEAQFKRLLELNPNHTYIHGRLVKILEEQGKFEEAFSYQIKKLELDKAGPETIERFRTAFAASGWPGVVSERIAMEEKGPNRSFALACLYTTLGKKDRALQLLEKAYEERSFLIATLGVEPQLDPLRSDPRFIALVKRVGRKN